MATPDLLLARIRGEYSEMPGLRLTFEQACRLWQVDAATCRSVLENLVAERFLHRTHDGAYCAFPETRAVPVKATLASSWRSGSVTTRQSA
jgi:hypothetical protein